MASRKSCQKLASCLTEPISDGSKMDPLLTKAEPISNAGSMSVTAYLRREIITAQQQPGKGEEHVREAILQTPRSVKEGGGDTSGASAEIPQQVLVQVLVKQLCPCRPCRSAQEQR